MLGKGCVLLPPWTWLKLRLFWCLWLLPQARRRPRGWSGPVKNTTISSTYRNLSFTLGASALEGIHVKIQHTLESSIAEMPRVKSRRALGFGVGIMCSHCAGGSHRCPTSSHLPCPQLPWKKGIRIPGSLTEEIEVPMIS